MKVALQNLTKTFPARGRRGDVVAVDNLNVEFPDGKLVALLGPSGCGKSTTLYMICGLEKPTAGQVFFGEDDVTALPPESRGVGLVFQNYALYPHLNMRRNIMFPLENLRGKVRPTKAEMNARVEEAARLVQIEGLLDRKPAELSGGQQQRVAIARALVKRPRVLLLDEPLSNLDARLRLQTREEIRRIQRETGVTTVFVTHDQEEAMSISDLIVVMREGALQQAGRPQQVYDDPDNLFVAKFLGTPPINVFEGRVSGGHIYIGSESVLDAPSLHDGEVYVAVRPEGFIPKNDGKLTCALRAVEVMGRDVSVVAGHEASETGRLRAIVAAESAVDERAETVRFDLKPNKTLLFDKETQRRIRMGERT